MTRMLEFYIVGSILIGFYISMFILIIDGIRSKIKIKNIRIRQILISFLYTLVFGLGVLASGGDPGFAMPLPLIIAIPVVIIMKSPYYFKDVIIPFAFWWILIFLIMIIRTHFKRSKVRNIET